MLKQRARRTGGQLPGQFEGDCERSGLLIAGARFCTGARWYDSARMFARRHPPFLLSVSWRKKQDFAELAARERPRVLRRRVPRSETIGGHDSSRTATKKNCAGHDPDQTADQCEGASKRWRRHRGDERSRFSHVPLEQETNELPVSRAEVQAHSVLRRAELLAEQRDAAHVDVSRVRRAGCVLVAGHRPTFHVDSRERAR